MKKRQFRKIMIEAFGRGWIWHFVLPYLSIPNLDVWERINGVWDIHLKRGAAINQSIATERRDLPERQRGPRPRS
jgi:hypothetical protein